MPSLYQREKITDAPRTRPAFDKHENKVVLLIRQTFRVLIPLYSADVKRLVVLQMRPVDVDKDGRIHTVRPDPRQPRKRCPLNHDGDDEESGFSPGASTPKDIKGKAAEATLSQSQPLGIPSASGSATNEPAALDPTITKTPSRKESCTCAPGSECCRGRWCVTFPFTAPPGESRFANATWSTSTASTADARTAARHTHQRRQA